MTKMIETTIEDKTRMNISKKYWDAEFGKIDQDKLSILNRYIEVGFNSGRGRGLVVFGEPGCGKTYAMCALMAQLKKLAKMSDGKKSFWGYMIQASVLDSPAMRESYSDTSTLHDRVMKVDLLVIDNAETNLGSKILADVVKLREENLLSTILVIDVPAVSVKPQGGIFGYISQKYQGLVSALGSAMIPLDFEGKNYKTEEYESYRDQMKGANK